jgi:hypothetical protein
MSGTYLEKERFDSNAWFLRRSDLSNYLQLEEEDLIRLLALPEVCEQAPLLVITVKWPGPHCFFFSFIHSKRVASFIHRLFVLDVFLMPLKLQHSLPFRSKINLDMHTRSQARSAVAEPCRA